VMSDSQTLKGPEPPAPGREADGSTQSRIDRAITELTPAVEAEPTTAEAHQHRGEAWARKAAVDQAAGDAAATTDLDRAIQEFTEAIRLKPDLAAAYHGRGDSWARKGDQDQAITDLNEAIRRNPNDALAYLTRAAAFVAKGQNDLAIVDLTRVIGLATVAAVRLPGSKLVVAYDTRARLYGLKGLDDREAADLGKMIDICIKDPHAVDDGGREGGPVTMPAFLASAHVRRAEALLRLRRNADAIADFRKALAIDPDLRKPKEALARLGITP
jgi:tetratricopeptide (TPR) repeat protein